MRHFWQLITALYMSAFKTFSAEKIGTLPRGAAISRCADCRHIAKSAHFLRLCGGGGVRIACALCLRGARIFCGGVRIFCGGVRIDETARFSAHNRHTLQCFRVLNVCIGTLFAAVVCADCVYFCVLLAVSAHFRVSRYARPCADCARLRYRHTSTRARPCDVCGFARRFTLKSVRIASRMCAR